MPGTDVQPGIHEVHSFEVDEFDCIRGVVCGGQTLLESVEGSSDRQLPFAAIFSDNRTRDIYMRLVEHVRATSETISFPYRCDNDTHCIYLRTVVFLSSSKRVGFLNKVTGYDERPAGVRLIRQFDVGESDYYNCSICNRFTDADSEGGGWHEFQTLVETKKWPAAGRVMKCNFDICGDCDRSVSQRIDETLRTFERRTA